MNGNESPSHPSAGLQVMLGHAFTLTNDEIVLIRNHMRAALSHLDNGPMGWRVLFVREITFINRIIRGALDRAHTDPPTRVDLTDDQRAFAEAAKAAKADKERSQ